jgi:hypothetical protein
VHYRIALNFGVRLMDSSRGGSNIRNVIYKWSSRGTSIRAMRPSKYLLTGLSAEADVGFTRTGEIEAMKLSESFSSPINAETSGNRLGSNAPRMGIQKVSGRRGEFLETESHLLATQTWCRSTNLKSICTPSAFPPTQERIGNDLFFIFGSKE